MTKASAFAGAFVVNIIPGQLYLMCRGNDDSHLYMSVAGREPDLLKSLNHVLNSDVVRCMGG